MEHVKNILITGASGLIGSHLTKLLQEKQFDVRHLGRSSKSGPVQSLTWNVAAQTMDKTALDGVQAIVHLAGAGVAEKRWSEKRKLEILNSRIDSTRLLFKKLQSTENEVETVVAASAIGYYGFERDEVLTEASAPGKDFLADVTKRWEEEVDKIIQLGVRVVKLRIGIVLSREGGALQQMAAPVRLFAGAPLGSGNQIISWIHIDDLCEMFVKAIKDPTMIGAYNAVAPNPVSNRELTRMIGRSLAKPVFLPPVPGFVLRLMLGEMAEIVLAGSDVSPQKIIDMGFQFKFTNAQDAVTNLLRQ